MAGVGCHAFSQDDQYYAFCGNDGKLKIWETANNRLKHEYTPNRHLSSPCSVIKWISVSSQSTDNVSVSAPCALVKCRVNCRSSFSSFALFMYFPYMMMIKYQTLSNS